MASDPTDPFYDELLKLHQSATIHALDDALLARFLDTTLGLLFPQYTETPLRTKADLQNQVSTIEHLVESMVLQVGVNVDGRDLRSAFVAALPELRQSLHEDAYAIHDADPVAPSFDEIVIAYPGFFAIAAYRIAHLFQVQGIPIIPRIITEHAHSKTGVDIHPGAKIGRSFCIDHGTGVVIGETSIIGSHVKIFQGVTLGGLAVHRSMTRTKRHPTIEDNVVIYANATVLGGDTVVGHDSIIGGNVWLTRSVRPFSKIYHRSFRQATRDGGDQ